MEVVGVYARLSRLRGRTENIDTQHDLSTQAAQHRWPGCEVRLYADPDASGEREDVVRPDFERLKTDVADGTLTQLVAGDQDRFTRRPDVLEDFISILRRAGIDGFLGYRDGWTPVGAGKAAGARYKGVAAKEYVEGIVVKTNERLDFLAAAGRPGGGHCYGYRHGTDDNGDKTLDVDEERAKVVRWAAEVVLAGWSLSAVARELESRGEPTLHGGRWSHGNVKGMLTNPTVAGFRVKAGRIVRRGNWTPILDEVTWNRLRSVLGKPREVERPDGSRQRVTGRRAPGRRYLLTGGIAVCGRDGCGAALVARRRVNSRGVKEPIYFCDRTHGGCGKLGVNAEPFEAHVTARLHARLLSSGFAEWLAADVSAAQRKALTDRLDDLKAKRKRLALKWTNDDLSEDDWDAARADLDARTEALRDELAALPVAVEQVDPTTVVEGWDGMNLDERRHQVGRFLGRVVVLPATPGVKRFDPARVRVYATDGELL